MDGVPLRSIAETPGFDPVRTWGPGPLLLIQATTPGGATPFMFSTPEDRTSASRTDDVSKTPLKAYLAKNAVLVPIRKTKRNAFDQVTIGRARNNDIRLSDRSVSKVHAYVFAPPAWPMLEDGGWRLRDANSTNGTAVSTGSGEIDVPAEAPGLMLRPGMLVRLGSVSAIYVDPDHLREALEAAKLEWERADQQSARKGSTDTDHLRR